MNAVPFDTLKLARRLEAAGLAAPVAAGASEALAEAMSDGIYATRDDITEVKADIASLRTEVKHEIAGVKADIASLRTEVKADIASLRTEMKSGLELLRRDMTIKLGSMLFIAVGVLLAAMRLIPPHL
jgi:hypothetical protein